MKFNEKLIQLRKNEGLSQEELGYKLNVTRQTISKWELGQTSPEMDKLKELARIFNITVDELIGDNEITNESPIIEDKPINEKTNNNTLKIILILVGFFVIIYLIFKIILPGIVGKFAFDKVFEIKEQIEEKTDFINEEVEKANEKYEEYNFVFDHAKDMVEQQKEEMLEDKEKIEKNNEEIKKNIEETKTKMEETLEQKEQMEKDYEKMKKEVERNLEEMKSKIQ